MGQFARIPAWTTGLVAGTLLWTTIVTQSLSGIWQREHARVCARTASKPSRKVWTFSNFGQC
eukprot:6479252-Amphidinium_carterae.1